MIGFHRGRVSLLAALSAVAQLAHAGAQPPSRESATMPSSASASSVSTLVEGEGAKLRATFVVDGARQRLSVRYRIDNAGAAPLAVFDRGDAHAVLTGRQAAGAVGAPLAKIDGDDVTLSHVALPLPTPAPTAPPTPLAARLDAGGSLDAGFDYVFARADAPRRVRWCLGVAPFAEDDFAASKRADVWSASFAVVERQRTLCTPWYDLAAGAFEGD